MIWAGEWAKYSVTAGQTYEWSLLAADGAVASYDSVLTLRTDASPGTPLCFSDDAPGGTGQDAKIRWTSTITGLVRVQVNLYAGGSPCATNSTDTTLRWRLVPAATGTLNTTVTQVSSSSCAAGATQSGAIVQLYSSGWTLLDSKTTNGSGVASWTNLTAGSYNLKVLYNGEFWRYESPVAVNSGATTSLTLTRKEPRGYDFGVYSGATEITGGSVPTGTPVTFRVDVRNCSLVSRSVRVKLWNDQNQSGSYDYLLGPMTISASGGTSAFISPAFTPTATGAYYGSFEVEIWEPENSAWVKTDWWPWAVAFTATVPPQPDLTATVNGNLEPWVWGQGTEILLQVTNGGTGNAGTSVAKLVLSNDATIGDADDIVLSTSSVTALSVGGTWAQTVYPTLPSSPPAGYPSGGTIWIGLIADANGTVSESNENNNSNSDSIAISMPQPDLTSGINVVASSIQWGNSVSISFDVFNTGSGNAAASVAKFVMSSDSVIGNADDLQLTTVSVPTIAAGGSWGWSIAPSLPSSPPSGYPTSGTIWIGIVADSGGAVAESNEANNTFNDSVVVSMPSVGNLSTTVTQVLSSSCEAGATQSGAIVQLYDSGWTLLNSKTTNGSGVASWTNLTVGSYNLKVLYNGEFWRYESPVAVNSGATTSLTLTRKEPRGYDFGVYSGATEIPAGGSVPTGTPLTLKVDVRNCSPVSRSVRVKMWIDQSQSGAYDYLLGPLTIATFGTSTFTSPSFTPTATGAYYRSFEVEIWEPENNAWVKSDFWPWSVAFTATFNPYFYDATISNTVDLDGDGYKRQFDIGFDVDSNAAGTFYVKIYEDDLVGDDYLLTTEVFSVSGTASDFHYATIVTDSHNLFHGTSEYLLELYNGATNALVQTWTATNDPHLGNVLVELSSEDAVTGNLDLTVTQVLSSSCEAGATQSGAIVQLYDSGWTLLNSKITNGSGVASWTNLTVGSYNLKVLYNGEFWRYESPVAVNSGATTSLILTRKEPRGYDFGVFNGATEIPAGGSVWTGTPFTFKVDVRNCSLVSRSVRVKLWIDQNQSGSYDYLLGPLTISALGGTSTFTSPSFTPTATGAYYRSFEVEIWEPENNAWVKSDFWPWSAAFTATASTTSPLEDGEWTILIHGANDFGATYNNAMDEIANHIQNFVDPGNVEVHTMDSTTFVITPAASVSKHNVLIFNWAATAYPGDLNSSTAAPDGYGYAAGDALFAMVKSLGIESKIRCIIGYSRGAVVASECARRLQISGAPPKQVIYLDGEGGGNWPNNGCPSEYRLFEDCLFSAWAAAATTRYDNIYSTYIENCGTSEYTNFGGNSNDYCYNYNLENLYRHGDCGGGLPSILEYLGLNLSYNGSRYVFPDSPTSAPVDHHDPNFWDGHPFDANLFNGDFSWYGPKYDGDRTAGWTAHGGGGDGYPITNGGNPVLVLDTGNTSRTHSWFWMPTTATGLRLIYLVENADQDCGNPAKADSLRIKLSAVGVSDYEWIVASAFCDQTGWLTSPQDPQIGNFAGKMCKLMITLDPGSDGIDSEIWVDNVQFTTCAVPTMPVGISASDGSSCTSVQIAWSGVSGATGYAVYRDGVFLANDPNGVSPYADTSAVPGVAHNYQVVAMNSCGQSALSIPDSGYRGNCGTVISVPSDYATPQAAINAASATITSVLVGPGTYAGGIDFKGKALRIESTNGPLSTFILPPADGSSVVKAVTGEGPLSEVVGFTIQQGVTGTPLPDSPMYLVGGGIFVNYASPTFRNCVIRWNVAPYGGGAYLLQSNAVFVDCQFYGNAAGSDGGNAQCYGGGVQFVNCSITGGVAQIHGGGLHFVGGNPSMMNCDVSNNDAGRGGGFTWYRLVGGDEMFLSGCNVQQNAAVDSGGGIWMNSGAFIPLLVRNSMVCNNAAAIIPANISGQWLGIDGTVVCDPPPAECPADLDGDGTVNGADLSQLLGDWSGSGTADLNHDGVINGADLASLLSAWGLCPN